MTLSAQQEAFSKAFAQAVCAVAGFATSSPDPDVDSVDWIAKGRLKGRSAQVDIQLKCWLHGAANPKRERFSYELSKIKNYDDLREADRMIPLILVVVRVPSALEDWLAMSHEQLVLAHCAYWVSLRGMEPVEAGQTSRSVPIPTTQIFTPEALKTMMEAVAGRDFSMFEGQVPR